MFQGAVQCQEREGRSQRSTWGVSFTRIGDPRGAYPSPELVFQAMKGLGCTLRSFDGLSLDDFISSGSVAACCHLKRLSLAPYYAAQMK